MSVMQPRRKMGKLGKRKKRAKARKDGTLSEQQLERLRKLSEQPSAEDAASAVAAAERASIVETIQQRRRSSVRRQSLKRPSRLSLIQIGVVSADGVHQARPLSARPGSGGSGGSGARTPRRRRRPSSGKPTTPRSGGGKLLTPRPGSGRKRSGTVSTPSSPAGGVKRAVRPRSPRLGVRSASRGRPRKKKSKPRRPKKSKSKRRQKRRTAPAAPVKLEAPAEAVGSDDKAEEAADEDEEDGQEVEEGEEEDEEEEEEALVDTEKLREKRERVINEIHSTEGTYVTEFGVLIEHYLIPIRDGALMPPRARDTLLTALTAAQAILSVHIHFYEDMLNSDNVLEVFIEYVEYFKVYQSYVQAFPVISRDMTRGDHKPLRKFLKATTAQFGHQGITQLLILPIQRIPRYLLLLDRLEDATPEFHETALLVRTVLAKMHRVAKQVDECQKQSENSACLFEYQQKLREAPPNLRVLLPTRVFVKEGTLSDMTAKPDHEKRIASPPPHPNKHSVVVILFNDLVLITDLKYKYIAHYDVGHTSAVAREDTATVIDFFSGPNNAIRSLVLLCLDQAERDEWVQVFGEAARERADELHRLRRRQAQRPAGRMSVVEGSTPQEEPDVQQVGLFFRIRPFVTEEEIENATSCVVIEDNTAVVTIQEDDRSVERVGVYDEVFPPESTQQEVFDRVGQEILGALFAGYNAAVMAYGNTGAGKTYTMFGNGDEPGLIPRLLENIFEVFGKPHAYAHGQVEVSFLQVYNNELQDLQLEDPGESSLKVTKTKGRTVVKGLTKTVVHGVDEALELIDICEARRATRSHLMNDMSSRSHAVFVVELEMIRAGEDKRVTTTLHLIDLAGSESAKETGVTGDALVEARHINQSLTALGRVVGTLLQNKERVRKQPVPFRETKLTHLLTDVLTGNFVCSMIVNASPSPVHDQAVLTARSMAFGAAMKKIDISAQQERGSTDLKHWLAGLWGAVKRS